MSEAARLVGELTTLLYEPCLGTCLTHGPDCLIVACGACRRKADKPESVVHDSDCPVYRLIRAEETNTAVIRANAEEIADLEDVRDALEAQVNALTAALLENVESTSADGKPCWCSRDTTYYQHADWCRQARADMKTIAAAAGLSTESAAIRYAVRKAAREIRAEEARIKRGAR